MSNYSTLISIGLKEDQIKRIQPLSDNGETIFSLIYILINELAQSVVTLIAK